ncbi:MAG: histone deacetylase family protein [Pseudomonadota bacterium]
MNDKLFIYHHDDCLQHDPGPNHPENAGRLRSIMKALRESPLQNQLQFVEAPLGTKDQVVLAHDAGLWDEVNSVAPRQGRYSLDPDTHLSPGSLNAALRGVGGACAGIDALMKKETQHAFCLTRPPGHHATPDHSMGFCIFNHVAIAALHAMQAHGLQRVAVMDFDVHHGNGTQDICVGRQGLLYVSTHQFPHYPGTGSLRENRAGNIHNVPLHDGMADDEYQDLFSEQVLPQLEEFQPELLLVSAGFDAHANDPLASIRLTESTYRWLGVELRKVANSHCDGRLLSVLEGGYNLDVLGSSVLAYCSGSVG